MARDDKKRSRKAAIEEQNCCAPPRNSHIRSSSEDRLGTSFHREILLPILLRADLLVASTTNFRRIFTEWYLWTTKRIVTKRRGSGYRIQKIIAISRKLAILREKISDKRKENRFSVWLYLYVIHSTAVVHVTFLYTFVCSHMNLQFLRLWEYPDIYLCDCSWENKFSFSR